MIVILRIGSSCGCYVCLLVCRSVIEMSLCVWVGWGMYVSECCWMDGWD